MFQTHNICLRIVNNRASFHLIKHAGFSLTLLCATVTVLISGHVEMLVYALRLVISKALMLSDSRALQHLNTISTTASGLTSEPSSLQSALCSDSLSFSLGLSLGTFINSLVYLP